MSDRLQDGIYFRPRERAAPCYRLLLLNAVPEASSDAVGQALTDVLGMLAQLPQGHVRERVGQSKREVKATARMFSRLCVLVGFGRRLFDQRHHQPALVSAPRPEYLAYLTNPQEAFPLLPWQTSDNPGQADFALQLTGDSQAGVNCAAIEVWKLLVDDSLPLQAAATFTGFQRTDGRGWLEFHDGVSNIESSERLQALQAPGQPAWMAGGTYMAFLRLALDLAAWRRRSKGQQELLVGREKLSGAPLVGVRREGETVGVPAPLGQNPSPSEQADYLDPPQATDPLLEASHLHRANQNRASPSAPAGQRIYRQGYDFLDDLGPEGPSLGLNFVSFQGDLAALQHLLHLPGWLGDVNFGGPTKPKDGEPPPLNFVSLLAGGFYAVPPRAQPFAGAELFG